MTTTVTPATELGFVLVHNADHDVWTKVRDDGRRGRAVGDEAALWQALQAEKHGRETAEARVREAEAMLAEGEAIVRGLRDENARLIDEATLQQEVPADDRPRPKKR